MKILELSKKFNLESETEYLYYCLDSYFNGQLTQCKELFKQMNKKDKKKLIELINSNFSENKGLYQFYFELL